MSKVDDFKQFIKGKPELIDYIKDNGKSMQDLYEIYDIYGEDEDAWEKYTIDRQTSLKELTNLVKGVNIDSVQKYINNAQKAINVIQELTSKDVSKVASIPKSPRPITKFFGD